MEFQNLTDHCGDISSQTSQSVSERSNYDLNNDIVGYDMMI
jgi:hypothetical protein